MNLFNHALHVWAQHREFRAVFAELARLPIASCATWASTASDIARIAYQEAERRIVTPAASSTPCHRRLQPIPAGRRVSDRCPTELQPGRRAPVAPSCRELPERNLPC